MGTRCGPIDPSIVTFMIKQGMTADEVDNALNKKSGVLGVSGVSSDAREVWAAVEEGNHRAKLAMDLIVHYTKQLIGSYVAEMNGVDVIVMTAGMGENDNLIRNGVLTNMQYLGIEIDEKFNLELPRGTQAELSTPSSKVKVWVVPTDEELMIAKDTEKMVKAAKA